MEKGTKLLEGSIWKGVVAFAIPLFLGNLFQQLYNTVDSLIVGNFLGSDALAAVSSSGSLIFLLVGFFNGIAVGAGVVISKYFGARDYENLKKAVHTDVAFGLVSGLLLTVIGMFLAPQILVLMGTPESVLPNSILYFRIYFAGSLAFVMYNIVMGILQAVGDSRHPLYYLIFSSIVNIVLDLLLVVVFHMGVAGVAIATICSQLLSAVLVVISLMRSEMTPYQLFPKRLRIYAMPMRSILMIGVPTALQSVMYNASNIVIQASINSFGTDAVAAWTAYGKMDIIFWMTITAMAQSITTFAGQNFGAQKYDRIRRSVRVCLALGFGSAVLMSVLYCSLAPYLLGLFTRDAEVVSIGLDMVRQLVPYYFTYVCIEILAGAARGCGCSLAPMLMTCGGVCVLRVAWIFILLPLRPELSTVLVSYPASWVFTSVLFIFYYLQGGWLRGRIRKMGYAPEERGRKKEAGAH